MQSVIDLNLDVSSLDALEKHLGKELSANYSDKIARRGKRIDRKQIVEFDFDGDELTAKVSEKSKCFRIRMVLPLFEENGYSFTTCDCSESLAYMDEQHCHHMWAVQSMLHEQIRMRIKGLRDTSPAWKRICSSILECIKDCEESSYTHAFEAERVSWIVDQDFICTPCLEHYDHHSRSWRMQSKISLSDFAFQDRYWILDSDRKMAARVAQLLHQEPANKCRVTSFTLLQELSSTTHILKTQGRQPIDLVSKPLTLKLSFTGAQVSLGFKIAERQHSSAMFFPDGVAAWSEAKDRLYLSPFIHGGGQSLKDLYDLFADPFSVDDFKRISSALSSLQKYYPIEIESSEAKLERVSETLLVYFRMSPLSSGGICAEVNLRPLAMYDQYTCYLKPSIGNERIYGLQTLNRIYYTDRNLEQEKRFTEQLILKLGLDHSQLLAPYVWKIADDSDALELLDRLANSDEREKIIVEWPKDELKAYEIIEPQEDDKIDLVVTEKEDWFQIAGEFRLGEERIELLKLLNAYYQGKKFVKLSAGQWLKITDNLKQRLQLIAGVSEKGKGKQASYLKTSPQDLEKWENLQEGDRSLEVSTPDSWKQIQEGFRATTSKNFRERTKLPALNVDLRSYQIQGFHWLMGLYHAGLGGILADDMGLGKTVQTIALLQAQSTQGPSLIICPSSVVSNWLNELARFAPSLLGLDYRHWRKQENRQALRESHIVFASYGLLLHDFDQLAKTSWNIIVLDEAQHCKNPDSKTFKSAKFLRARLKLALSGTPIENSLGDLWTLFALVNPSLLGPWAHFKETWATPIEQKGDPKKKCELQDRIGPFLLRRLKSDYLSELPPKTEKLHNVFLSKNERELYHRYRLEAISLMTQAKLDGENSSDSELGGDKKSRMELLSFLGKLRQICSHPAMVEADWHGSSAKEDSFVDLAKQLAANRHRTLVFSQFPRFLQQVEQRCQNEGFRCLYFDGSTKVTERTRLVAEFQKGQHDFFFISLKAGGTGINLTSANCIVHLDPWWNPAVEAQATDRAHRMGQKEATLVYRFVCYGTIEEKMLKLHKRKRNLAGDILSQGEQGLRLGQREIESLLTESDDIPTDEDLAPFEARLTTSLVTPSYDQAAFD